ncbi:heat shock protein 70 family [Pelagophyceae sp. CCMP2097]|nr:heat shock protein 70 family [Pelagophyceae sp. CCMP2097]|mmetsp:Transcript_22973/g.81989  ORF Transcript_22973/g.81989 Transcript_22973/m.81989 type:complete len:814 (+) Transcript_22973:105-2546(+)
MTVCGVDFGCLNASVAQAQRGGITVLLNESSNRLNPNVVSIQGKQRFLGEAAASIAKSNYRNTAKNIKRLLGKRFADVDVEAEKILMPGVTFCDKDGFVAIEVDYADEKVVLSMPQLAAMMLFKLSSIAADNNGGMGFSDIVVSVPAYFGEAERLAMLDACKIANINCLRLMNDLTATALEYGIWRSAKNAFDEGTQKVMFIDCGFSAYQVSIVEYQKGALVVKATTWDRALGGRDFDMVIAQHINDEFKKKHGCEPIKDPKAFMKLLDAAEKAKKTLSPKGVAEARIFCECLLNDLDFSMLLTLEKFSDLVAPLLARLDQPVMDALREADDMDKSALHSVEITGGGSRVAAVKFRLAKLLGLDDSVVNHGLKTTLNADECVSKGCAMMAAIASPRFKVKPFDVVDAVSYGVKLSWEPAAAMETEEEKGEDEVGAANDLEIFERNEAFPKSKRITFRRGSTFDVAASYAADGLPIGAFKIVVPEGGAVAKVRLAVDYSFSGTLQISSAEAYTEVTLDAAAAAEAKDNEAKDAKEAADAPATESKEESKEESNVVRKKYTKAPLVVTASMPNMTQAQLDSAKEVEVSMANEDRIITETFDMRNELEAYIYKMRDEVVGPLRPFTTDTEKAAFEASLEEIENWLYEAEYDTTKSSYKEKLGKLEALGSPLAARQSEDEKRPETVALLRKKLAALEAFLAAVPTAVPGHYDKEEVATVTSNAAEGQRWLAGLVSRQSALSKDQDAVLTCSMVTAKHGEMDKNTKQILSKKPPVSETKPPTPAPEAADAKAADAEMPDAKAAEPKDEDMPDASPKKE